jgi:hypothetical protein
MSSAARETCGFSTISLKDLDSLLAVTWLKCARLRLITIKLPTRVLNMAVLSTAMMDEYAM